jgi:hypothetical protein
MSLRSSKRSVTYLLIVSNLNMPVTCYAEEIGIFCGGSIIDLLFGLRKKARYPLRDFTRH